MSNVARLPERSARHDRPLFLLDGDPITSRFDRSPLRLTHDLCVPALLQRSRPFQRTQALGGPILRFRGVLLIDQFCDDPADAAGAKRTFVGGEFAPPRLSPGENTAHIGNCDAWMPLRNVGSDPAYARLLQRILGGF